MTNMEFARRVGCHFTMASRLRNGHRVPSASMLARIVKAFDISNAELQELWLILAKNQSEDKRASDFGQWLRDTVFIEYAAAA